MHSYPAEFDLHHCVHKQVMKQSIVDRKVDRYKSVPTLLDIAPPSGMLQSLINQLILPAAHISHNMHLHFPTNQPMYAHTAPSTKVTLIAFTISNPS